MKHFISIIFILYWFICFLFQFPKESLLIGNIYQQKYLYDRYFYQNWSFFAPPPQSNYEIFYLFEDKKNNKIIKINILENIHRDIQDNFPFNDTDIQKHYVFFAHLDNILTKTPKILEYSLKKISKESVVSDLQARKKMNEIMLKDYDYMFFINHAKKLKKEINLNSAMNFKFEIYSHDINKFNKRYQPNKKNYDNYVFKSKSILLE